MNKFLLEIGNKKYWGYDTKWEELDGGIEAVLTGPKLLNEDFYIVTDFSSPIDTRIVSGDPKYTEVLLAKQLKEEGEVVGSIQIVSAKKKNLDNQSVSILYQAVPIRDYVRYVTLGQGKRHTRLLIPYSKVFNRLVKIYGQKGQTGVIVINKESEMDIVVYKDDLVIAAKTQKIIETNLTDISLSDLITDSISRLCEKQKVKPENIKIFDWAREVPEPPDWHMLIATNLKLNNLENKKEEKSIQIDGKTYYSSLIDHLDDMTALSSIGSGKESINQVLLEAIPIVALVLLLANIWMANNILESRKHLAFIEHDILTNVQELNESASLDKDVVDTSESEKLLDEYKLIKPILSDLYNNDILLSKVAELIKGAESSIMLEGFKVEYPDISGKASDKPVYLNVKMAGRIGSSPYNNEIVFNQFLISLSQVGFVVTNSRLGGNNSNLFAVTMEIKSDD